VECQSVLSKAVLYIATFWSDQLYDKDTTAG
jgi:hypothetical protein